MTNPFSEEEKKFSLCLPSHGDKWKHYERFFDSLDKQEYKNFETIVTIDGKSRKHEKELEKMIKKYSNQKIEYHTIKHAGACAARNNSAKYATGDYYVFTSPDCWLYPEALRVWANAFDEHPEINRVWGHYDVEKEDGSILYAIGQVPFYEGKVWYEGFKWSPYSDASFPIRKEAFIPWDTGAISLNDWEYSLRLLKPDFKGEDWLYIPHSFFVCEYPVAKGLSNDSNTNWEERKKYVQEKNGIVERDVCVTSLGAPNHGIPISKILDAEYLPMPSFKAHHYKMVYLLGFYTREDPRAPRVTRQHMDVFAREGKYKKVVHWIGSDIHDLFWADSFMKLKTLRKWFKDNNIIHLCECKETQKELKEIGIDAKIIPIPPKKEFKPMPLPKKFTVGIYLSDSGRDVYNPELMMEVIRSMPDIQFYIFGGEKGEKGDNYEYVGYIDMEEWLPKMSCNVRVTDHDGLPITPIEFLMAGRNVVTNVPLKGAIKCEKDRKSIVSAIRQAQKTPLNPNVAQYVRKEFSHKLYKKRIRRLYD